MPALHELQAGLARAILTGDTGMIGGHLQVTGADPLQRLRIYRNNTFVSLTDALMATFPAVVSIVDERFFRYMAHTFIAAYPPDEPILSNYGADLASFIAGFDPCRSLPYLADLARLEWAINAAGLEGNEPALPHETLTKFAPQVLVAGSIRLQPSLRLVVSRWPILALWQANQPDTTAGQPSLERRATRVLVRRKGCGVSMDLHSAARVRFLHSLRHCATIEAAMTAALVRDPHFNPAQELLALFKEGLVTGFSAAQPRI
jgi:Putative DNA-binding domain